MALLDNLIGYWKLDEASGTRNDAHGTNHLTDNNTVGSAAGTLDNAALFDAASSEYLNHADNADLSTGDIDFTVAAWVYLASKGANRGIVGKYTTSNLEYTLYYIDAPTDRFILEVAGAVFVQADTLGSPSLNTWYHVVVWHDAGNNEVGIAVNAGTSNTASYSGGITDGGADFDIGRISSSFPNYWDGRIDEVGFWKRVLTSQERTDLYNGGNGLAFPFGSAAAHRLALLGVGG